MLHNSMRFFPFSRFTVFGNSMLPTLKSDQEVLCFNWAYFFSKPKIGDIVVIKHQGKEMIKRVKMYDGRGIFVVGDNFRESVDSRSLGLINGLQIIGKIIWF